ncbi:MAG: M24 family metallopeptidase [Candidatus Avelusimicrobium sp.]|uniref:M24 family metallopeptidase n=1 Tax=Candidatus Avelusimicrobium sp. TaxID=3048833 RepID=UPI003F0AA8BD
MSERNITAARLSALRGLMRKNKLDGLVVTNNLDQLYLTNFFFYPEETVLLVHGKGVACFTRDLYVEPFGRFAPEMDVKGSENRLAAAVEQAKKMGLKRVGFDAAKESYQNGKMMSAAGFAEVGGFISKLRETKDAAELKLMREANRIAYQAYEYVKPLVKTGMTESELAAELEKFMRAKGASGPSFLTIVGFGENSANPHHETGSRKLEANDAVLMDFGCIYKGYCSDITRSWWHGNNEPAEYKKIWKIVEKARKTGVKAVQIGTANKAVDAAARGVIADAGYGEYFTHRTGHGVGIEIHEQPYNSQTADTVLAEGNVVTVEPGIYLPGKYGVRLEDTMAVGKTGAKILTKK